MKSIPDNSGTQSADTMGQGRPIAEIADGIRRRLAVEGGEDFTATVLDSIKPDARKRGVSRSERATALSIYSRTVMEQTRERELLNAFLEQFWFRSESDVREAAGLWHQNRNVTLQQSERNALLLLKTLLAADPTKREAYRSELFGEIAVVESAGLLNGHKNGSANGNGAHP